MKQQFWIALLPIVFAGGFLFAETAAKPTRKTVPKKAATKKTATAAKRRSAPKKPAVASWRSTQRAPTPERYKEIQEALASKGYLRQESPRGVWDTSSVSALKKFQQDQNLEPSGKLDSLSIIALGLGPKRDQPPAPHP